MMVCERCGQKATVHYDFFGEKGQSEHLTLCESCAQEAGILDPESLSSLHAPELEGGLDNLREAESGCPRCQFTLTDWQNTGRLGCPHCYETFREEIASRLHSLHRGLAHVGRVPQGAAHRKIVQQQKEELRRRLDQAVASEEFEEAARLKVKLGQLGAGPSEAEAGQPSQPPQN